MEIYPIVKGQLNSYYDYNKIFELQRMNVEGKIQKVNDVSKKNNSKSLGPSLILRKSPRSTNRGK